MIQVLIGLPLKMQSSMALRVTENTQERAKGQNKYREVDWQQWNGVKNTSLECLRSKEV